MERRVDILAVGNLVWEVTALLPDLSSEPEIDVAGASRVAENALQVVLNGGGSAANALVAAAAQGMRCVLVGRAGDDDEGRRSLESLRQAGVDARVDLMPGRRTKRSWILKEAGTDRGTFRVEVPPRSAPAVRACDVPDDLVLGARVLHLDRVSATGLTLARRRAASGLAVTLDLHDAPRRTGGLDRLRDLLPCLAMIQVGEGAAADLSGRWGLPRDHASFAATMCQHVPRVVVTLGASGAVGCERGARPLFVPATAPRTLVDSTGAGDAFAAAVLSGMLRGEGWDRTLRGASDAGARACEALGARGRPQDCTRVATAST